jgi:hypothetical protein
MAKNYKKNSKNNNNSLDCTLLNTSNNNNFNSNINNSNNKSNKNNINNNSSNNNVSKFDIRSFLNSTLNNNKNNIISWDDKKLSRYVCLSKPLEFLPKEVFRDQELQVLKEKEEKGNENLTSFGVLHLFIVTTYSKLHCCFIFVYSI